MPTRFKVRFPNTESFKTAQRVIRNEREDVLLIGPAGLKMGQSLIHVRNNKRNFISIEPSTQLPEGYREEQFDLQLRELGEEFGATIVEDFRYNMEADIFEPSFIGPEDPNDPSLDDVLSLIEADKAWMSNRGGDVIIAVVDTGIDGMRPEFPQAKRVGSWQPLNDAPWTDWRGHGTMCACIAAGTTSSGGILCDEWILILIVILGCKGERCLHASKFDSRTPKVSKRRKE